jgi:hypothetical protein
MVCETGFLITDLLLKLSIPFSGARVMKLYSEDEMKEVREIIETEVLHKPAVTTKRMFGCPSYKVNNTLFGFLVTNGIVLTKLSEENLVKALQIPGAEFFEHKGRVVKKWVQIPLKGPESLSEMIAWLWKSYEHALDQAT